MSHTFESLAAMFLNDKPYVHLTQKQSAWLSSLIYRQIKDYRNQSLYCRDLTIESPRRMRNWSVMQFTITRNAEPYIRTETGIA